MPGVANPLEAVNAGHGHVDGEEGQHAQQDADLEAHSHTPSRGVQELHQGVAQVFTLRGGEEGQAEVLTVIAVIDSWPGAGRQGVGHRFIALSETLKVLILCNAYPWTVSATIHLERHNEAIEAQQPADEEAQLNHETSACILCPLVGNDGLSYDVVVPLGMVHQRPYCMALANVGPMPAGPLVENQLPGETLPLEMSVHVMLSCTNAKIAQTRVVSFFYHVNTPSQLAGRTQSMTNAWLEVWSTTSKDRGQMRSLKSAPRRPPTM